MLYFPGAIYHVMLRGNGGMQIFFLDEDRYYFYFLIEEGIKRYGYEVHAFCLMTNHVHLLIRIGHISISKVIQNICFRYTRWINKRKGRIGHLFQGRYKSILVDGDCYFLELIRYIHLNPVKATLTNDINNYCWSSHPVYIGLKELSWVTTDWVLSRFSNDRTSALSHYSQFLMKKNSAIVDNRLFKKGNQRGYDILANDDFMEKIQIKTRLKGKLDIDLDGLVNFVCDYYKLSVSELKNSSRIRSNAKIRALIAIIAQDLDYKYTLTNVAAYFNRDVTGIIRTIQSIRKNISIVNELEVLKKGLTSQ